MDTQALMTALTAEVLSPDRTARTLGVLRIDHAIADAAHEGQATRAAVAMALNICLFDDLLDRVPSGAAYVADVAAAGGGVTFDHGALRTILMPDGPTGALPGGEAAFRRIFEPLGYAHVGTYPLPRLRMTGRAYAQADFPQAIPQFFLSELHVDQFSAGFAAAAARVFGGSTDPLGNKAQGLLAAFAAGKTVSIAQAAAALPEIVRAFDRQHERPMLADYEVLLGESAEAGWIATEGNAFNHATDRVSDVEGLADIERAKGRPMKDKVEISASGRVRQTAFRADTVERRFGIEGGGETVRAVPGSFYEFITRDDDPETGGIDLRFDSANATGIFAMTKADA